jgi:hypothetical protein
MLHLFAEAPAPQPSERLRPEPVTRLASLRNALRVVDEFGGGPADDCDEQISVRWESAAKAAKRCFDRRSAEMIAVATTGLELIAERQKDGIDINPAAKQVIADELRDGFDKLQKLFR